MSAVVRDDEPLRALRPMDTAALDDVLRIEQRCYAFPWSRGNFVDSIVAGHWARCLVNQRGEVIGYGLAMPGVEELHLLNLTIAPEHQHRGHARFLLDALCDFGRVARARQLWLEVRPSNERARVLYQRYGFEVAGLRRGYYPDTGGREDAIVMRLPLDVTAGTP